MASTQELKESPEQAAQNDEKGDTKVAAEEGNDDDDAKNDTTASNENAKEVAEATAIQDSSEVASEPASSTGEDGDNQSEKKRAGAAALLIPSKPKKARTGYMIFQDNLREKGLSIEAGESWLKVVGQKWAAISDEEKEAFREMASKERDQVAELTEQRKKAILEAGLDPKDYDDNKDGKDGSKDAAGGLVFPVARIKRIAKLDPEVKNLSKEAIHLVVKAAELFTARLGQESTGVARIQNRRTLLPQDVAHVCKHVSAFTFLKDDIQDLVAQKLRDREENIASDGGAEKAPSKKEAQLEAAAAGSKPLTAYFGASTNK